MDPQQRDKLLADAKRFRRIARLLQAIGQADGEEPELAQWLLVYLLQAIGQADGEEPGLAQWLLVYADQLQNEACGMAAPAVAYDRDVRSDYAHADDTNYGD